MTVAPPNSQQSPLPTNLPFKIVSKTIGQGAYASIRKATPPHASSPVIAVKFINKQHAFRAMRVKEAQIQKEIALHHELGQHHNIIRFYNHGEDPNWIWVAMELAEGGDLFDKIEADVGVGEDIAHLYFSQLVSAVGYMHSKGIAHRDIKPENILLSGRGDLKIADFGLAALVRRMAPGHSSEERLCSTMCGSPPYIAPEIVALRPGGARAKDAAKYRATVADIWSVGVVLFVLLVGNTPWDAPTEESWEFCEYEKHGGRGTTDELWSKIPNDVLSLLRGMLKLNPANRFSLDEVRTHPWFTRRNPHLDASGRAANPLSLATQMLQNLRIDVTADTRASQRHSQPLADTDGMDMDTEPLNARFSATQPETPVDEASFDWEPPTPARSRVPISASQPANGGFTHNQSNHNYNGPHHGTRPLDASAAADRLSDDPSFSQFSQTPAVPLSLTQAARRFGDIVPAHSLCRFVSACAPVLLVPLLTGALHRLGIPTVAHGGSGEGDGSAGGGGGGAGEGQWATRLRALDQRHQPLVGWVRVEQFGAAGAAVTEVRFIKSRGDPLEWRRLFKKVCVICKDVIVRPDEGGHSQGHHQAQGVF